MPPFLVRYKATDGKFPVMPSYYCNETSAILNAINAVTRMQITSYTYTTGLGYSGHSPSEGANSSSAARMNFETELGTLWILLVPDPDPDQFYTTGSDVVDPSLSAVAAIVSAVLAHGRTKNGHSITAFRGGYRIAVPTAPIPRY